MHAKYEYHCTALCWDKTLHSWNALVVADSTNHAQSFIDRWNIQGQGKYSYTLTGKIKEITRNEYKTLILT